MFAAEMGGPVDFAPAHSVFIRQPSTLCDAKKATPPGGASGGTVQSGNGTLQSARRRFGQHTRLIAALHSGHATDAQLQRMDELASSSPTFRDKLLAAEIAAFVSGSMDPGREQAFRDRTDADPALAARVQAEAAKLPPDIEAGPADVFSSKLDALLKRLTKQVKGEWRESLGFSRQTVYMYLHNILDPGEEARFVEGELALHPDLGELVRAEKARLDAEYAREMAVNDYVNGDMNPAEKEAFEARMADDAKLTQLVRKKIELEQVYLYVRDQMAEADKAAFEARLSSDATFAERVATARAKHKKRLAASLQTK